MILAPYFWNTENPDWIQFGVFLCSGGRSLWSVDSSDSIKPILTENGFPLKKLTTTNDVTYAEIDYKTLKLENFYTWDEVDYRVTECDVWRITRIPVALWSCEVFKHHFWKSLNIPSLNFTDKV